MNVQIIYLLVDILGVNTRIIQGVCRKNWS